MAGKNTPTPAAAAATAAARTPITETGTALLALIAAAEGGSLMLTQAEAGDIVNAGFATVDTSNVEGETAAVSLTDAGKAELDKANAPADAPKSKPSFEVETGVAIPGDVARRGRASQFPFDALEIGQSFHVPATTDNPNPVNSLFSSTAGARVKYSEEIPGEFETKKVKTYKKGDDGKFLKDENGKRIVDTETEVQVAKTRQLRDFVCKAVGDNDPKGKGARVWRTA